MSIVLEKFEQSFALASPFVISRGSRSKIHVIAVSISDGEHTGWGECVPYGRYGETLNTVSADIEQLKEAISSGLTRAELQSKLPAGAARNAIDCALWDLEAKQQGSTVWQLAGLPKPKPVTTAFTLSLGTPEEMLERAQANADRPLLKIKLGDEGDVERIKAIREGAPESKLIVDANEGWSLEDYQRIVPTFAKLGVSLIEQPLPADDDEVLKEVDRPIPLCADESCHDRSSLSKLQGKYDLINIKVDKTGGLTEAIALQKAAIDEGFGIMVGCMLGSSLAMAPAHLLAQSAQYVDLDGPLLLAEDREPPFAFEGSDMLPAKPALWG